MVYGYEFITVLFSQVRGLRIERVLRTGYGEQGHSRVTEGFFRSFLRYGGASRHRARRTGHGRISKDDHRGSKRIKPVERDGYRVCVQPARAVAAASLKEQGPGTRRGWTPSGFSAVRGQERDPGQDIPPGRRFPAGLVTCRNDEQGQDHAIYAARGVKTSAWLTGPFRGGLRTETNWLQNLGIR